MTQSITYPTERDASYVGLVDRAACFKDFTLALTIAKQITYTTIHDDCLRRLVGQAINSGLKDLTLALSIAKEIRNTPIRDDSLMDLVTYATKSGQAEQATPIAQQVWLTPQRDKALRQITDAIAKSTPR